MKRAKEVCPFQQAENANWRLKKWKYYSLKEMKPPNRTYKKEILYRL